jgi:Skp family chaperone for outer membrane proteins
MLTNIILHISSFLLIGALADYIFFNKEKSKKIAFVHNQKFFEQFKGTAELKVTLEASQNKFKAHLDSIATLIQGGQTDLTPLYRQRVEELSLQHQQLAERYTADIWKNINAEVLNFDKDNGYDFILGASGNGSLMYASEAKDITEAVTAYANAHYEDKEP